MIGLLFALLKLVAVCALRIVIGFIILDLIVGLVRFTASFATTTVTNNTTSKTTTTPETNVDEQAAVDSTRAWTGFEKSANVEEEVGIAPDAGLAMT